MSAEQRPLAGQDPNSTEGLTPEQIKEMRKAIHEHLLRSNTYDQLRQIIASHAAEHVDFNPSNPDDVMTLVKERGIVQEVLGRINSGAAVGTSRKIGEGRARSLKGIKAGQRYLHLRLLGGRAFLDNVDADPKVLKQQQMVVSIHFDRQRLRSTPTDCHVDPTFDDDFLLELNTKGMEDLVDMNCPLNIIVTKEDVDFYRSKIIGENSVDWRKVLQSGYLSMSIELAGENPGVPAGIVELQLELIPAGRRYNADEVANTMQLQRTQVTSMDREFLIYARRWWSEFQALRPTHAQRRVKIFAATPTGRTVPVTHFISPMQPDRVMDRPSDAARFVSLIGVGGDAFLEDVTAGAASADPKESWLSPFSFLAQRRGSGPNHATLLCSLLLGFGLDAYCAIGSDRQNGTRIWVVTRTKIGNFQYDVLFWEPTTGQRYAQTADHPFVTVGCVFNHQQLYANVQDSDNAVTTDFDLDDEKKWKSMNPIKLKIVHKSTPPPLLWIPLDTRAMEVDLEQSLMQAIQDHRQTVGVPGGTAWDRHLPFVLSQALIGYENQRTTLEKPNLAEFQQCIKGTIGEGRTFKGFPLNTTNTNSRRILSAIAGNPIGKDILELAAEETHLAVRVRITPFPEGVFSVWVMIAARYKSLG
jgi:centrosomal protein CEP76